MADSYDQPTDKALVSNVSPDELSTNQQLNYPYLAGTQPVALMWVGQIYNQRTVPVKQSAGGKK